MLNFIKHIDIKKNYKEEKERFFNFLEQKTKFPSKHKNRRKFLNTPEMH